MERNKKTQSTLYRRPKMSHSDIEHLMTGPDGNSEFRFPRTSMLPETKSRETLRFSVKKIHWKKNSLFTKGLVI